MTKRDFFILFIKLFGVFSLVTTLFSSIPNSISMVFGNTDMYAIVWILAVVAILGGLFVLLVFKADKVVELLKLDKGFEDNRIELGNIRPSDVIRMGTFIIGGFLILDNVPAFLNHALFAFKGDVIGMEYNAVDKFNWAVSGVNLIVGYLLINNYDVVAKLLVKEKK